MQIFTSGILWTSIKASGLLDLFELRKEAMKILVDDKSPVKGGTALK
jgi:hypothetical protein